jgi:1-deoxy-D-xylulose-5-phosphate reductoisomerase
LGKEEMTLHESPPENSLNPKPVQACAPDRGAPRRVAVLGATGSIGLNTLDLIGRNPEAYEVVALAANCNAPLLAELAVKHRAKRAVLADASRYGELKSILAGTEVEVAAGAEAVVEAASEPVDWTMAAIIGAAGLRPTFAAMRQGGCVALANKECLVSAGAVFMLEARRAGASIIPVDSEHSAAFQAIGDAVAEDIEQIALTASGGPFRTWTIEQLAQARPEQALKHPNWAMGRKITVDSATLMNKGLELIEAYHLFPVDASQLSVVVHPQSIVHCLVHFCDGSVLAQLSTPDMRTPIAFSLGWPRRMAAPTRRLDLAELGSLTFEAPDEKRFPALRLAREALATGSAAAAVLNAANEIAVEAYLDRRLGFLGVPALSEAALERAGVEIGFREPQYLEDVLAIDAAARELALRLLPEVAAKSGC